MKLIKRGAIELSVSTIVIMVLAVIMLIIGVMLVGKIGCGAISGINAINDQTKAQIINIFNPEDKLAVKEVVNEVNKGVDYGVGFGIKDKEGTSASYSYLVEATDLGTCKFSKSDAEGFIVLGKSSSNINIGEEAYVGLITFSIPVQTENCNIKYRITVNRNGQFYDAKEFQIKISNKGVLKSFC